MIDVKHLSKSFGHHLVLDDISQHIHPGEKVVIIGPSGSGKSTFLRCLNLLEEPTAGEITFDGTLITDPKVKIDLVRRQMGMVFQHFNLFPNMTIRKNITLAPVRTGLMKQAEADALMEKQKAADEIRHEIADVSTQLTEKLLEREIRPEDHRELIDSFLQEL